MASFSLTTGWLADACGADCRSNRDAPITGVVIDSRRVRPGDLFVALSGSQQDGHDYIPMAAAAGCAAVLASKPVASQAPLLLVDNVEAALTRGAAAWRRRVNPTVIGVTGSSGKTTVKEMLLAVLRRQFSTHATVGNLNNHLGVPMTLLAMAADCQVAVVEMGMNNPGEIAHLAQVARPDIGVITNVHPAHLAGLGSVEAIARAKGELLEYLAEGVAVFPGQEPYTALMGRLCRGRALTFGTDSGGDWYWRKTATPGMVEIFGPGGVCLSVAGLLSHGDHIAHDATAVAAVCCTLGMAPATVQDGLATFRPPAGRGGVVASRLGEWQVMDDCYNANPGSMAAALGALAVKAPVGHRVAVLGDMLELGPQGAALHGALAAAVLAAEIDVLCTTGPLMASLHEELKAKSKPVCYHHEEPSQWLGKILTVVKPGDVVLVKGSRGMYMERLVAELIGP